MVVIEAARYKNAYLAEDRGTTIQRLYDKSGGLSTRCKLILIKVSMRNGIRYPTRFRSANQRRKYISKLLSSGSCDGTISNPDDSPFPRTTGEWRELSEGFRSEQNIVFDTCNIFLPSFLRFTRLRQGLLV